MPFRNVETHFSKAPEVSIKRSSFKYNLPHKFTFNAGDLVPFMCQEVLPGDTFDLKLSKVVRLTTSIHPTMDNLYLDTYFFFVPNRFCWDNWQKFMGENDQAWTDNTVYVPPYVSIGGSGSTSPLRLGNVEPQSVLNYLGIPVFANNTKQSLDVSLLPLNAYLKVWNDWFRSENLIDEVPIYKVDGLIPASYYTGYATFMNNNFGVNVSFTGSDSCLKVAKFADYFTRALPQPQKGADVLIPAGGDVIYNDQSAGIGKWVNANNGQYYTPSPSENLTVSNTAATVAGGNNLIYDPNGTLSLKGLEITVNNLRLAIQTQRLLEKDARGGSRYIEIIRGHFGVISPDLRLQRSEYLGGKRTLINMTEVIQTSESSATSPLGNLGGRSITTGIEDSFIKSFTEHGFIIGVCCVRPDRTYSEGIERMFFRKDRLDYYFPVLANIGEQPIYEREIFLPNSSETVKPDDVFGYQEAWAEYRTQRGKLSGFMQPGITNSLGSWTYGDHYTASPLLSAQWLYQGKNEIDRTLAIPSATAPQFIADFLVYGKAVRPLPVYSIPGLMDHN